MNREDQCEIIELVKLTSQPIINTSNALYSANKTSKDTEDSFICGNCQYHFNDINLFLSHKHVGCISNSQKLNESDISCQHNIDSTCPPQTLSNRKDIENISLHYVSEKSKLFTLPNNLKSSAVDINLDKLNCKPNEVLDDSMLLPSQSHGPPSDLKGELFLNSLVSNDNQPIIFNKEVDEFTFLQPSFSDYTPLQSKNHIPQNNINNQMIDLNFSVNSYNDKFNYSTQDSNISYNDTYFNHMSEVQCHENPYLQYPAQTRYDLNSRESFNEQKFCLHNDALQNHQNNAISSDIQITNSCFNNTKPYIENHDQSNKETQDRSQSSYFNSVTNIPTALKSNFIIASNEDTPVSQSDNQALPFLQNSSEIPIQSDIDNNRTTANIKSNEILLRKSKKGNLYSCEVCQRGFKKSYDLEQHMRSHTGEKPFQCMICGRSFSQRSNVKKHLRTHKVWPNECSSLPNVHTIAVKLDANKQLIIRPTKSIDSLVVKREYRLLNNSGNTSSLRQQRSDEPIVLVDNSFECRFCRQRFTEYNKLRSHIKTHKSLQVYLCVLSNCGQKFERLAPFLEHLEQHKRDKETIYSCFVCSQQFSNLYSLAEHTNQHKDEKKGHSCPTCRKSYTSYISLQQHLALCSHRYACSHCDKTFSSELVLRRHISIHASIRKFQCPHCSNIYKAKSSLAFHLRTHRGEYPFKCEQCNKSFLRRDKYCQHIKQHESDSSTISCPLREVTDCGFTCVRNEQLIQHVASVHWNWMKRPAACAICKKRFSSYYMLKMHFKTHRKQSGKRKQCSSLSGSSENLHIEESVSNALPPNQLSTDLTCHLCKREFQRKKPFETHLIMCQQKVDLSERRKKRREQRKLMLDKCSASDAVALDSANTSLINHTVTPYNNTTIGDFPKTRSERRAKFKALWEPKRTRRKPPKAKSQDSNSLAERESVILDNSVISPANPLPTSPSTSLYNLANLSNVPACYNDHSYSMLVNQLPPYALDISPSEDKHSNIYDEEEEGSEVVKYNLYHSQQYQTDFRAMLADGRCNETHTSTRHLMELPSQDGEVYSQPLPSISTLNSIYSSHYETGAPVPDTCVPNYTIQSTDLDSSNFFSEPLSFLQSLEPIDQDIML